MYKELLAQTPLIALPLAALFIFLGVFIVVVLRATTRAKQDVAYAASLPLAEEEGRHGN